MIVAQINASCGNTIPIDGTRARNDMIVCLNDIFSEVEDGEKMKIITGVSLAMQYGRKVHDLLRTCLYVSTDQSSAFMFSVEI